MLPNSTDKLALPVMISKNFKFTNYLAMGGGERWPK
jgi:hypothetical protein